MENGAAGVERLELVLNGERLKNIVRVADGEMGAVCVVGSSVGLRRCNDVREALDIVFGETVG